METASQCKAESYAEKEEAAANAELDGEDASKDALDTPEVAHAKLEVAATAAKDPSPVFKGIFGSQRAKTTSRTRRLRNKRVDSYLLSGSKMPITRPPPRATSPISSPPSTNSTFDDTPTTREGTENFCHACRRSPSRTSRYCSGRC